MRKKVNEQCKIISANRKTSGSHQRGKTLKPITTGLLKAIERLTKMADYALRNRISWL